MTEARPGWTDEQVEQVVGNLLRVGVIAAAAVVLLGACVYVPVHAREPVGNHYQIFRGEPTDLRSPVDAVRQAVDFRGRGLIQLGLLLLIATPVARVIFSAFAFARQHDWTYVVITLVVLTVLVYSIFSGDVEGGNH
jgi:uncharacterized membrane protein